MDCLRLQVTTRLALFAASGVAWAILFGGSAIISAPALCTGRMILDLPSGAEIRFVFAQIAPDALAASWAFMLVAMMVPLLDGPLRHVRARSLSRDRYRNMWSFVGGYLAVWFLAGVPLIASAVAIRIVVVDPALAFILAAAVAAGWQAAGWKRVALNRCHSRPSLAGKGAAAIYGVRHGLACLIGCAPLMIAALLASAVPTVVMAVAALWIWAERIEPPRAPGTGPIWPRRAARVAFHRVKMLFGLRGAVSP